MALARTPLEASLVRRVIGPALLIAVTPIVVVLVWMIAAHFDGSISRFAREADLATILRLTPRPSLRALAILGGFTAFELALLVALPGRIFLGPPTPTGQRPRYKLNGVAAWAISHAALVGGFAAGVVSPSSIYRLFPELLVTSNALALVLCLVLYLRGRFAPSTPDAVYTGHFLFDFFQGIELHPRWLGVSLKQLINCRVSMMGWSLLLVSFAAVQWETRGAIASSMLVSALLLVAYLFKFFVWESGYFTSLDIMHDRFGFYICWGVLVWVPGVYTVFGQYLVNHPRELDPAWAVTLLVVGFAALAANYAADAQRQRVRATGGQTRVWGRAPRLVRASYLTSDGEQRENLLLASGYWGIARHFHYVPELTLALCWALPAGLDHFLPYLYFVFLFILLVDRARRDDLRCQKKYGAAWDEYRRMVPYRILPGIY